MLEKIFKSYKLITYGDKHYITNSFCKKMCKKQQHFSLGCELHVLKNVSYYHQYIFVIK